MENTNVTNTEQKSVEVKQVLLSSTILDILFYIQLADTKVFIIIMATIVSLIVNIFALYELIW